MGPEPKTYLAIGPCLLAKTETLESTEDGKSPEGNGEAHGVAATHKS